MKRLYNEDENDIRVATGNAFAVFIPDLLKQVFKYINVLTTAVKFCSEYKHHSAGSREDRLVFGFILSVIFRHRPNFLLK